MSSQIRAFAEAGGGGGAIGEHRVNAAPYRLLVRFSPNGHGKRKCEPAGDAGDQRPERQRVWRPVNTTPALTEGRSLLVQGLALDAAGRRAVERAFPGVGSG